MRDSAWIDGRWETRIHGPWLVCGFCATLIG